MKRAAILLFTVFYLISTIGITVSRFYCCRVLQSTYFTLTDPGEKTCSMDSSMPDCCKTLKSSIKIKDHHLSSVSHVMNQQVSIAQPVALIFKNTLFSTTGSPLPHPLFDPPSLGLYPIYLFTCTYRI